MTVLKEEFMEAQASITKDEEKTENVSNSLIDSIYMAKSSIDPTDIVESQSKESKNPVTSIENENKKKKELIEEKQEKEGRVASKTEVYKQNRSAIMKQNKTITDLEFKKKEMDGNLLKSKEELVKHQKILQLLPDGEENLNKLINIVQKSKDRVAGLQKQWENHKGPIEKEYLRTIGSIESIDEISKKGKRNQPSILEKIEKVQNSIKEKEVQYKKMLKLTESLKEGETRDTYTNRILDILKQIEKLREGIDAVILDVKTVQKDINMQNGKLERSYFEISITMKNKMNNKEPDIEQSMLLNKSIHEVCFHTVESIRRTGALGRESREIQEQIRSEESKGLKAKINLLTNDLKALQSENKELAKQYKKVIA